jgi:hypothetical protein
MPYLTLLDVIDNDTELYPFKFSLQKPGGVIALLDEAWYAYHLSSLSNQFYVSPV